MVPVKLEDFVKWCENNDCGRLPLYDLSFDDYMTWCRWVYVLADHISEKERIHIDFPREWLLVYKEQKKDLGKAFQQSLQDSFFHPYPKHSE